MGWIVVNNHQTGVLDSSVFSSFLFRYQKNRVETFMNFSDVFSSVNSGNRSVDQSL